MNNRHHFNLTIPAHEGDEPDKIAVVLAQIIQRGVAGTALSKDIQVVFAETYDADLEAKGGALTKGQGQPLPAQNGPIHAVLTSLGDGTAVQFTEVEYTVSEINHDQHEVQLSGLAVKGDNESFLDSAKRVLPLLRHLAGGDDAGRSERAHRCALMLQGESALQCVIVQGSIERPAPMPQGPYPSLPSLGDCRVSLTLRLL